jgi:hypothetical protein
LYNAAWVKRLQRNVSRFAPPHRFVALSDCDVPCERIPLKHDWPRWWPILEVFRPGLFSGRVVYLDLADLIVDRIDKVFEGSGFIIAPDPYTPGPSRFASGLMAFDAYDNGIYERFAPIAAKVMPRLHGDQEWISELRPTAATFEPGIAVSYKGQCRGRDGYPDGAAIIFCHGQPKPHEIADTWFRTRWDIDL